MTYLVNKKDYFMYARSIKITFKDKMSKDMFVNYTDNKVDSEGIKNGTLMKFIFNNSDTFATIFGTISIFILIVLVSPF